jgi:hypothetical protein
MKLARISKPLRSVQVRVMLSGDLNVRLERYARYYQHVHGETVDMRVLIPEILGAFLDADREFQSWPRSAESQPPRVVYPASSSGGAKVQP